MSSRAAASVLTWSRHGPSVSFGGWLVWALALTPGLILANRDLEFFEKEIRPLLVEHCYECHSVEAGKSKGGLRLDSRAALLDGGDSGPAVVIEEPDSSLLVEAVAYHNQELQMPPDGALRPREIEAIRKWVAMGVPDPRKDLMETQVADTVDGREHWSFQPLAQVSPPQNGQPHPVDAFITERLTAEGLSRSEPADRRTLLRRVTFDLTGLPPTTDEVEAFLSDAHEGAFDRVVERLLASPHYGERWGRHWLDVARYSDSNGLDENLALGTAWRYRDWVVNSLNEDKPFDRFVVEQLAGDLLPADSIEQRHQQRVATAFLNLGAKVLAEPDKEKLAMDIVDEQLDSLGKALLGMTFGCARCHDHKFDPVSQKDYYALAAILKSTSSLSGAKRGAISQWYETPLGSLDEFAAVKSAERRLTAAKKELSTAEAAAEKTVLDEGRAKAEDYLVAALQAGPLPSLEVATRIAREKDLKPQLIQSTRNFLDEHVDEPFFAEWHQAKANSMEGDGEAVAAMRSHYQAIFGRIRAGEKDEETTRQAKWLMSKQGFITLPAIKDSVYPEETVASLMELRSQAVEVEKSLPDLPTSLAVRDADEIVDALAIHIRGSHRNLGDTVPRGVPEVMQASMRTRSSPRFPRDRSGRLELANWLVSADHPLTARVIVNRVWTWHFGRGLVATPDNFGLLGDSPSHPELLDWLAGWFIQNGWSLKKLHRLILSSETWQQGTLRQPPEADPENRLLSGFSIRRLEAEELRDAILEVAGLLDLTPGGKTVPLRNRQFVFNHTSKDATRYDSTRRSLYLPVIRNNLFQWYQQFDFPDPTMPTGQRGSSTISPQALLLMNHELVEGAARHLAESLAESKKDVVTELFQKVYGRPPTDDEHRLADGFLVEHDARMASSEHNMQERRVAGHAALAQTLLMSHEFVFVK